MFVMALKNGERKMNQFVPKLFDCMKSYTKEQFVKDVISGIIVAIIALPLSIALVHLHREWDRSKAYIQRYLLDLLFRF